MAADDLAAPDAIGIMQEASAAGYNMEASLAAAKFGARQASTDVEDVFGSTDIDTVVVATRETPLPDKAELQRRATNMNLALGLPASRWLRGLKPVTSTAA